METLDVKADTLPTRQAALSKSALIRRAKRMFKCDSVRIMEFDHCLTKYLIIGYKKRSEGEWERHDDTGEHPFNFDYTEEHVIAHANTWDLILKEAKFYKSLQGMSMLNYLKTLSVSRKR